MSDKKAIQKNDRNSNKKVERRMKVCLFGSYAPDPMNTILKKKLEMQGVEYVECHEEIRKNIVSFVGAYLRLLSKHRKLDYDILILPLWRALLTLPLARMISKRPILYYGYMPIYDTVVNDRKMAKPNSLKARVIYFVEKMCWHWSDMIIKESYAEIDYFANQFGVDKKKFRRLFIGADESKFPACPLKEPQDTFVVFYHGTFIPHHGTDTIIEAAKILSDKKDIVFRLCGDGQTRVQTEVLAKKYQLKNVEFLGWVEFDKLLENIDQSDTCLGIFGDGSKASYGITNKLYQILCSQKPLITRDSMAVREINAEDKKNCVLVPPCNPQELARAILYLKENVNKRRDIAMSGRRLFVEHLSLKKTSEQLLEYLSELQGMWEGPDE